MASTNKVKKEIGKNTQSLQVLPKNAVIQGKKMSQGGELVIISGYVPPDELPEEVGVAFPDTQECESDRRKGRVCIMGPLADTLHVNRFKDSQKGTDNAVIKSLKHPELPTLPPLPPTASFIHQEDKAGGVGLKPSQDKTVSKTANETVSEATLKSKRIKALAKAANKMKPPTYQPNCSDIVRDLERNRLQIAQQIITGRNFKSEWRSSLPWDLKTLPDHTVLVRWRCCYNLPCFTLESAHAVLSRFSPIVTMAQLSPNSALVVFEDENIAKMMVSSRIAGFKNCPLICDWWDKTMYHSRPSKETTRHDSKGLARFINTMAQQKLSIVVSGLKEQKKRELKLNESDGDLALRVSLCTGDNFMAGSMKKDLI